MILKNVAWVAFERSTRILVSVFVTTMVARALGVQQYGQLALVISIALFVQTISQFGLDRVLIADLSRAPKNPSSLLLSALLIRLSLSILAGTCALILVSQLYKDSTSIPFGMFVLATSTTILSFEVYEYWFIATSQSKYAVLARLHALLASAALKLVLISLDAQLKWFFLAHATESLLIILGLVLYGRKRNFPGFSRTEAGQLAALAGKSAAFGFTAVGVFAYTKLDQLLIAYRLGSESLGIYAAAMPFSTQTLSFIPIALCTAVLPALSRQSVESNREKLLSSVLTLLLWVALPISATISIAAPHIVDLLLGKEYSESASILQIHIFSFCFSAIGTALSYWVASTGKGYVLIQKTVVTALLALSANFLFLKTYGLAFAAVVAVAAELFGVAFLIAAKRTELWGPIKSALRLSPIAAVRNLRGG